MSLFLQRFFGPLVWGALMLSVLGLADCGGGGGSATSSSINGVVATGVPLPSANVTLTDVNGVTKTTTTGADGSYSVDATGLTAPFVVQVSGISGDSFVSLTSALATAPVSGQSATINVTPLTTTIAAMLSGTGDPSTLSAASDQSVIRSSLSNVSNYLSGALANTFLAGGVSGSFDLISGPFSANGSGVDRVLDNTLVNLAPNGSVTLFDKNANIGSASDDSGEMTTLPTPSTAIANAIVLTRGTTNFSSVPSILDGSAINLPNNSGMNAIQGDLTNCFAVPAAQRGSITVTSGIASYAAVATACLPFANFIATNYLESGLNAQTQFSTNFLQSSTYDGAVFDPPYIVRFVTPTKAIVHISWTLSSGVRQSFETIMSNGSGNWLLTGNQGNFDVSIQPIAEKRQDLNSTPGSSAVDTLNAYTVGLNVRITLDEPHWQNIMWVVVTGNGLGDGTVGNGALLMPQAPSGSGSSLTFGCSYLTFVNNNASMSANYDGTAANGSGNCAGYYRIAGVGLDGSSAITWPSKASYRPSQLSDFTGFHLFEPYVFHIHTCSVIPAWSVARVATCGGAESDLYYVARLPALMPTLSQATQLNYVVADASTIAAITPTGGSVFTGGSTLPVSWDPSANKAPPVDSLNIQIADGTQGSCPITEVNPGEPFSASLNSDGTRKALATVSVVDTSSTTVSFPSAATITNANCSSNGKTRLNMVKYSTHRKDGLQIQSVIEYADY